MNSKPLVFLLLILCFSLSFSGLCSGKDRGNGLTVKKIAFNRDKAGRERITIFCNQSCVPELFSLEEEKLRVVMDMRGVSLIQIKKRTINTRGKLVKKVRNYLDKQTNILRVVLDMEPLKHYIVRPMQYPSKNKYVLTIDEVTSLSERKPEGSLHAAGSPLPQEKHITILHPNPRPVEKGGKQQEAAPSSEKQIGVRAAKDVPSVDQGRSQLNAGEFAASVDTFTQIITAHPQDSLSYRLRGNAYDNLGDRQKALRDWTQAARLGDETIQSYLDFLQIKWRENHAP